MSAPNEQQPQFLEHLREALSVLFSLNGVQYQHPNSAQAHEFLLQFQTRNIRRKLQSKVKQLHSGGQGDPLLGPEDSGSAWLCCLALLASYACPKQNSQIHFAEALFAAQTLVHRLRRVKSTEAIDMELERPIALSISPEGSILINERQLHQQHLYWVKLWRQYTPNSPLGLVIQHYMPQIPPTMSGEEMEHRIKCELSILTLAGLIFDMTLAYDLQHSSSSLNSMRPLIATLASALAVTAARLRFTPTFIPDPSPDTQPIVTTILHSLERTKAACVASETNVEEAHRWILYVCLTVLPDALLAGNGSGGGAHGSISMDPRCYAAVTTEVRTHGMMQVCQALQDPQHHIVMFFQLCQEWTKYAPAPLDLLQPTIPLIQRVLQENSQTELRRAALGFWITIMEGGALNADQVLASSLLQKQQVLQQPNKKKQSNKSKKRQKEVLEERTTVDHYKQAIDEVQHRNEVALLVARETISVVRSLVTQELQAIHYIDDEVAGEGPVGALVACANACVPFLVKPTSSNSICDRDRVDLIRSICSGIHELCNSKARAVRSFAAEALYTFHEAVIQVLDDQESVSSINNEMANVLVDHFYNCCMSLALLCGYPSNYFLDLATNNDEDLENERNDLRDILRTLAGTTTTTLNGAVIKSDSPEAVQFSSEVLSRLVNACAESIVSSTNSEQLFLFPETAMHAFSALARPLIARAQAYCSSPLSDARDEQTLAMALRILETAGQKLISAAPRTSTSTILPLFRLYNLAVASLSPMFSALSARQEAQVITVMSVAIDAAIASLLHVPELVAPSSLRSSRYDIRGAMRTPGGEDHAGCLSIMRLANESKEMAYLFIRAKRSATSELCALHRQLKVFEKERGRGVLHGKGVLPKSRRILLGVICQLEESTVGEAGALSQLRSMLEDCGSEIVQLAKHSSLSIGVFYESAEAALDLSSYAPEMIAAWFAKSEYALPCMKVLMELGSIGYEHLSDRSIPFEAFYQWNRLRAAMCCLFTASGTPDLPDTALQVVTSLIQAECQSITVQCNLGPDSSSHIFREDIISEDAVPAGILVHSICQILSKGVSRKVPLGSMARCIDVLHQCKGHVLHTILLSCRSPTAKGSFEDPRPMLAEAWILAMIQLLKGMSADTNHSEASMSVIEYSWRTNGPKLTDIVIRLNVETFMTCILLLLYPSVGRTQEDRASGPGASADGPHMLVSMEFFELFFSRLGPKGLESASTEIGEKIPVDLSSIQPPTSELQAAGVAVIGAAIFRANQGALPPWAVECMPSVFSSLYNGPLNCDPEVFCRVIQMSMSVRRRVDEGDEFIGSVRPGELFSGKFFQSMGDKAKTTFLTQSVETARSNTTISWKRFKSLIKQACGGKKKDTDFRQRPGLTKIDALDRV